MISGTTPEFWKYYQQLPEPIQRLADENYKPWLENPRHPSIRFKKLTGHDTLYSAAYSIAQTLKKVIFKFFRRMF